VEMCSGKHPSTFDPAAEPVRTRMRVEKKSWADRGEEQQHGCQPAGPTPRFDLGTVIVFELLVKLRIEQLIKNLFRDRPE
jgi:hypothetical protein